MAATVSSSDVTIRPLLPGDVPAAAAAARTALDQLYPEELTAEEDASRTAGAQARVGHLQETDPGGCWVAEHDGQVVGTAIGLIREDVWGFSLFALLPELQGKGIGTRLYEPALEYGARTAGGIILSTKHPAAMRRYARSAGYRLRPSVYLSGAWNPSRAPASLRCRPGDLAADAETIEAASRHVRGASHMRDLPVLLARPGAKLLVLEGEGFACVHEGSPMLLAATGESAAQDLLWGSFQSGPPGATVSYDFVTADQQWAIGPGLEAGLALGLDGPVFVRGELGPMAPYLPNGAYL